MTGFAAPGFWWEAPGWQAALLSPLAALYGAAAGRRLAGDSGAHVNRPVLCVGNFTAGGAGKTPTAIALAHAARAIGLRPAFLTRGHGGRERGPLLVDPALHGAAEVGDEPLLLTDAAPSVVARDRVAGALLLAERDLGDIILMDDGFQSARLHADLSLLVVDGVRGLGNGRVLPAGPLRAPLETQMARADAVLVVGQGAAGEEAANLAATRGLPVRRAEILPVNAAELTGIPLLAFAGIADPAKFRRSLVATGAEIGLARDFPDHHAFTQTDIAELIALCERHRLTPATTAKDAARLRASDEGRALLSRARVLRIEMRFGKGQAEELLRSALAAFEARRS